MDTLISVVILNWNGKKVIKDCIISIQSQTYRNLEIIIIDNASTDGSLELIKEKFGNIGNIRIIANQKNLGFDGGNNVGIKVAHGEYVMMLNNDTRLEPNCIEELKMAIERSPKFGACASKILLEGDKNLIDAAGIVVCPDGHSIGRGRLEESHKYNKETEVFFASDCACLYRKEMLGDIGLYDEDFFAYSEETDLGWRARLAGWKCIYNPKAIVYHFHSASTSSYSPYKVFLVERNRIWVAVKNFPLPLLLRGQIFTLERYFYHACAVLTGRGAAGAFAKEFSRLNLLRVLVKAYLSAFIGLPKMLTKRWKIQKGKRISTKEISQIMQKFGISAKDIALKG